MSSLLTALGLRAGSLTSPIPSYTPHYIIANFVFAFVILSARGSKMSYKIDHNENPRVDLTKFGEEAVRSGKITREQLEKLQRNEAAHANAVENFPLFVGALLWAHQTGVPTDVINASALTYTVLRVAYAAIYLQVTTQGASWLRTVAWWSGNLTCLRLFWLGGKLLNAGR